MIRLLLSAKVKQYFGHVRRSPRSVFSLVTFYLLWTFVVGALALFLRFLGSSALGGVSGALEVLSLVTVTSMLGIGAFLGTRGGVTAFPYEVEFVLTSPVRPHVFLLSDLAFQVMLLSLYSVPSSLVAISVLTYPRHLAYLPTAALTYLTAILMAAMTSHLLGVSRAVVGERASRAMGWAVMGLVVLPVVLLAAGIDSPPWMAYHPVQALALLLAGDASRLPVVSLYLALLVAAYAVLSRARFYTAVSPLLMTVLMEPPRRMPRYLRIPGVLSASIGLVGRGGLWWTMYALHLTRISREGSLWTGAMVLAFLTLVNSAIPRLTGFGSFPRLAELSMVAMYTPLLPALLAINWNVSERRNTWYISVTGDALRSYVGTLSLSYLTVTVVFSGLLYALISLGAEEVPFLLVDSLLLFAMSSFGSLLSVAISVSSRVATSPLSLGSLLYVLFPMLGSALLSLPVVVVRVLYPAPDVVSPVLLAGLCVYVVSASALLWRVVTSSGPRYLREFQEP
ncbi:MAG: hypothetical protein NYU90_06530 [Aigarchaeota archaeon]|nr:hypothetical protein [Candidatus Calditenuis fumarioli]